MNDLFTCLNRKIAITHVEKYGKNLAYVYIDYGKSLNIALLQVSLSKVVLYEPNDKYYNEYKAIEREVKLK